MSDTSSCPDGTVPAGPLFGVRVLLLGGVGPAPFSAMVLADLGAEVAVVVRPGPPPVADRDIATDGVDILGRGTTRVALDLKSPADMATALRLARAADVVIEGFRPGVAERLGLGPEELTAEHPRLIYVRVTGYGQNGQLAQQAGHDINFISRTGLLNAIGRRGGPPQLPLNVIGDYGGGGMLAALGVCAALWERERSGAGQVVDVSMVDGIALLMASLWEKRANGHWNDERGTNALDTGAPNYNVYETADARWIAVGSREPVFFTRLLRGLELSEQVASAPPERVHDLIAERFRSRTQAEWIAAFDGVDACVSAVQTLGEAAEDEALRDRGTLLLRSGHVEPGPAPRFSRTPSPPPPPRPPGLAAAAELWT